ncbi:MAG: YceI family protein [Candidatus Zixiibacteriota bacterium]
MFKRLLAFSILVISLALPAVADDWKVDGVHSSVNFSVRHMIISNVKGTFGDISGDVGFDGKNVEAGSVAFTIQIASIDTDNEKRDKHLRSEEFFNAEKYPTMSFASKEVRADSSSKFILTGDLTLKDVTKEVSFMCEFNGVVTDPWGNTRAGFSAESTIDRQEFNITWSNTLDGGGLVVGNDVKISLEIEIVKVVPEEKK